MHSRSAFVSWAPQLLPAAPGKKNASLSCLARHHPPRARLARVTKQYIPTHLSRGDPRAPRAGNVSQLLLDYLSSLGVPAAETDAALRAIGAALPAPALDDVHQFLRQAGFSEMEVAPTLSPSDSDAVSVRARGSSGPFGSATFAVRGLSFERRRGLLLRDKLRALGRAYVAPLALSQAFALRRLGLQLAERPEVGKGALAATLARLGLQSCPPDGDKDSPQLAAAASHTTGPGGVRHARRILAAGDPRDLLRASVVQEPAFALVAVVSRSRRPRALSKTRARAALATAIRRAVDPVAARPAPAPPGNVRVRLYRDVPWGLLLHMLPADERAVLPRTRDLLRVDLLTLLGLFSAVAAYVRDNQSPLLAITLAGTFAVYVSRIAFGLRVALVGYRAQIDRDKLRRVVAADDAAVDVLAAMAHDRRFALRAAAWAEVKTTIPAEQVRSMVFETEDEVEEMEWKEARDDVRVIMGLEDKTLSRIVKG